MSLRWRRSGAIVFCAALGFLCPAAYGIAHGVPEPVVHDEFAYLLGARTFAEGRLTNASPPLPEFFESPHVLVVPTYNSRVPTGTVADPGPGPRTWGRADLGRLGKLRRLRRMPLLDAAGMDDETMGARHHDSRDPDIGDDHVLGAIVLGRDGSCLRRSPPLRRSNPDSDGRAAWTQPFAGDRSRDSGKYQALRGPDYHPSRGNSSRNLAVSKLSSPGWIEAQVVRPSGYPLSLCSASCAWGFTIEP